MTKIEMGEIGSLGFTEEMEGSDGQFSMELRNDEVTVTAWIDTETLVKEMLTVIAECGFDLPVKF